MKYIIDLAYLLAIAAYSPKIIYRMLRQGRYRRGRAQKLGNIDRKNPGASSIWIHAVSVGEVNATRTLTAELEKRLPGRDILISTTTDTGYDRAVKLYGGKYDVFFFPFDFSCVMKKAFDRLTPQVCLLMELEVWPNFAAEAKKRGIPVIVVNGRLSERSFPRYKLAGPVTKWMFDKVTLFMVQSGQYADRFVALGCDPKKIIITSSLKYDTARITDNVPGSDRLAQQVHIRPGDLIWTAGGTGPGEEKIVLDVYKKLRELPALSGLRVVIVPRKPERFEEVAQLIESYGFTCTRYSELKNTETQAPEKTPVILGDTMGDLTKFYCLASVVFVGRSLVPMGGSDMMEPAALKKCTIFGPHTFNFTQTVEALLKDVGAIQVSDQQELFDVTAKCLTSPDFARSIADKGRQVIFHNQGATQHSVNEIIKILDQRKG